MTVVYFVYVVFVLYTHANTKITCSPIVRCQVAAGANLNFKAISIQGGISYVSNIVYNTYNLYDDRCMLTLRVQMESDFDRR